MALNKDQDLTAPLIVVFSSYPETKELAASIIASTYNGYALNAMSCAAFNPTLVFLSGLTNGLIDALGEVSTDDISQGWADAFYTYWNGAAFGATGLVTAIGGKDALALGLKTLWEAQSINPLTTFPGSAATHAGLLDVFTKTVVVTDSSIPCTAPII